MLLQAVGIVKKSKQLISLHELVKWKQERTAILIILQQEDDSNHQHIRN